MLSTLSPNMRGIIAIVFAVGFFSLMDSVLKLLSAHYPVMQIAALRGITALPLIFVYIAWRRKWPRFKTLRWPLHLFRGCLSILMLTSFTWAIKDLPLTTAYTIFFVAPMIITLLSIPFLGETVPRIHWLAIAIGFTGVLVVLRPDPNDLQAGISWHGLAVLVTAVCYAVAAITGRLLSRTDTSESIILTMMTFLALGGGLLALPVWVPVASEHLLLLLALAVTGFGGQLAITEAFRHGQASVVASFEYSALAWALGLDWWIWQSLPSTQTWIGATIIVACGVFLIRHERRIAKVHASTNHP